MPPGSVTRVNADMPGLSPVRRAGRWFGAMVALLAALLAAGYAAWPWLVDTLTPQLGPRLGLQSLTVTGGRPGWSEWTVSRVEASAVGWTLEAGNARLTYGWRDLVRGRLHAITVERVDLALLATDPGGGAPPADVAALFAAVPVDAVTVQRLGLHLPERGFHAQGAASLGNDRLALQLGGAVPGTGQLLTLDATLTPAGAFRLRLDDAGMDPPAEGSLIRADGALSDGHVTLTGGIDLHGEPLALISAALHLPAGDGRVRGSFHGRLPWPLDAATLAGTAALDFSLTADWRVETGGYGLSEAVVEAALADGVWRGTATGRGLVDDRVLPLRLVVDGWPMDGGIAAGRVWLGLHGLDADQAGVDAGWRLDAGSMQLDADIVAQPVAWPRLRDWWPALPGEGSLAGTLRAWVPWPVRRTFDLSTVAAETTLQGGWRDPTLALTVSGLTLTGRLADGALSGDASATVTAQRFQSPVRIRLDRLDAGGNAGTLSASGNIRLGRDEPAPFSARYDPRAESARLHLAAARSIDVPLLGSLLDDWREPYDLTAGRVAARADLIWSAAAGLSGDVTLSLAEAAGFYADTLAAGVAGEWPLAVADGIWSLGPAVLSVASVDVGVVVQDLAARLSWAGDVVHVAAVEARVLGGRAWVAPFDYHLADGSATFDVGLEGVDLAAVVALEGDDVAATGVLHGRLPVTLSGAAPAIVGGTVRAEPPGGTIRVAPSLAAGIGQPGLDFALRALQNFAYTSLDADVDYDRDGNLVLAVRLRGRNPDVEAGRPIHYNLSVQENVPTLLESLRLQERMTEGIERRMRD
jgi:hypothetical protein